MFDFNFKSALPLLDVCNKIADGREIVQRFFSCFINQKDPAVVDYIFYHNPSLITSEYKFIEKMNRLQVKPLGFLNIPSISESDFTNLNLPNEIHPSDHLPIIVDFGLAINK